MTISTFFYIFSEKEKLWNLLCLLLNIFFVKNFFIFLMINCALLIIYLSSFRFIPTLKLFRTRVFRNKLRYSSMFSLFKFIIFPNNATFTMMHSKFQQEFVELWTLTQLLFFGKISSRSLKRKQCFFVWD